MSDLLEKAFWWLEDRRAKFLARQVIYQRGCESIDVMATIGRTVFERTDDAGMVISFEARDFLVPTNQLVLGGQKALPERGDRILEIQNDQTFVYEVLAEPCWRYSDPYRRTLRIHTKMIKQGLGARE